MSLGPHQAAIEQDGEPPADRWEPATWTLVRRDGEWLVEAYHNSSA